MKPSTPLDKTRVDKVKPFAMESALKGLEGKRKKKIVLYEQKDQESGLLDESNLINHDI
jgi:hypothetical protein